MEIVQRTNEANQGSGGGGSTQVIVVDQPPAYYGNQGNQYPPQNYGQPYDQPYGQPYQEQPYGQPYYEQPYQNQGQPNGLFGLAVNSHPQQNNGPIQYA